MQNMSMNEKRNLVDELAVEIGYRSSIMLSEEQERFVWDLIDFGYPQDKVMRGRCSLKAQLDFDSVYFEKQMDNDIKKLNIILRHRIGEKD